MLRQCVPKLPRLGLNLQNSCLRFLSSCADRPTPQTQLSYPSLYSFSDNLVPESEVVIQASCQASHPSIQTKANR